MAHKWDGRRTGKAMRSSSVTLGGAMSVWVTGGHGTAKHRTKLGYEMRVTCPPAQPFRLVARSGRIAWEGVQKRNIPLFSSQHTRSTTRLACSVSAFSSAGQSRPWGRQCCCPGLREKCQGRGSLRGRYGWLHRSWPRPPLRLPEARSYYSAPICPTSPHQPQLLPE